MAPTSKMLAEKESSNNASESEQQDPDISQTEIDGYVLSVPNLTANNVKASTKSKSGTSKDTDILEATKTLRDPSTPKRPKANNSMQYLTPQSIKSSPLKSQQSTPGSVEDAVPKTPSRKARGMFGTDARVWSAQGYKSPCRTGPRLNEED